MGTNSIRSNLNKDTIISEIKLSIGADVEKTSVFLIVEGSDDIKLLKKFCNSNTIIYESFSGKKGVEEIITSDVINDYRVVGIRDRDYHKGTVCNRLFFYDKCCLEMMMVSVDEVFESIFSEFYSGRLQPFELRTRIIEGLKELSEIRKLNEEKGLNINFKGLRISKLTTSDGYIDSAILIRELTDSNPNKDLSILKNLNLLEDEVEGFEITNGHDFLHYFKTLCDRECEKKEPSIEQISSSLRTSFNKEHFLYTELYRQTFEYGKNNNVCIWSF